MLSRGFHSIFPSDEKTRSGRFIFAAHYLIQLIAAVIISVARMNGIVPSLSLSSRENACRGRAASTRRKQVPQKNIFTRRAYRRKQTYFYCRRVSRLITTIRIIVRRYHDRRRRRRTNASSNGKNIRKAEEIQYEGWFLASRNHRLQFSKTTIITRMPHRVGF